jgi:phage virion morphogenesis protein
LIRLNITSQELEQALALAIARLENPKPLFADIGEYLLRCTQENFENERDPEGRPWQALHPKTVARKAKQRKIRKILQQDGDLRGGINYQASRRGVAIGSPSPYAAIHQLGGRAGRNRAANIPARPYLGLSQSDLEEIRRIAIDFLEG